MDHEQTCILKKEGKITKYMKNILESYIQSYNGNMN